jgi:phenylpropionate dioxygenase-like ring-hydroxylating dioxygenase large terminal subunit
VDVSLAPFPWSDTAMLTTKQKTLRHFWYPTLRVDEVATGPKPFRLMGEDIVLFLTADGTPAALEDRCCHRTAKLSKGWCDGGHIVCGYHGWTYQGDGQLVRIPQFDPEQPFPKHRVKPYHAAARYGYVWVALEAPLAPIFDIPEDSDPGFRRIFQFYETWQTAPLRLMENSFDNAHFAFVHQATFGDVKQPKPKSYAIEETDYGFKATTVVDILNPPAAHAVTGTTDPTTTRSMVNHWYMPFARRMDMTYPSGIRHIIINVATPVADDEIKLVQLLYRNDTEADCSTEKLIAWDATIVREDKDVLESTSPDAILDVQRRIEAHMPSDRPGLIMRKRLLELLHAHGEQEVTYAY